MEAIKVNGLNVLLKEKKLFDNVCIDVPFGQVYTLFGKDTIEKRMLLKIIASGHRGKSVYVDNDSIIADLKIADGVCYIMQGGVLFSFMTAKEYLNYCIAGKNLSKAERLIRIESKLRLVGLFEKSDVRLKKLSAVEHKLLNIAVQLCLDKDLLIINADELLYDKASSIKLSQALKNIKSEGCAVLISLNDTRFVGDETDVIGVLRQGKIVLTGSPEQLTEANALSVYTLKPSGNINALASKFRSLAKDYKVRIRGEKLYVYTNSTEASKKVVAVFAESGEGLEHLSVKVPTLKNAIEHISVCEAVAK